MIKRLLTMAVSITAVLGTTIGFSAPADSATTSPAYYMPGEPHPLEISTQPVYKIYIVKSGNTLSGIAHRFDLSWKKLYCANRGTIGKEPSLIQPKMRLKIRESRHVWCPVPNGVSASPVTVTTVSATPAAPVNNQPGPVSTSGFGSFQQCVIMAESGGNPRAYNASSGASGLYGFLLSTWDSLGLGYPGGAYTAPVSVQNQGFAILYARDGTSPWAPYDGC